MAEVVIGLTFRLVKFPILALISPGICSSCVRLWATTWPAISLFAIYRIVLKMLFTTLVT